ncbi:hypothetical protein D9M69_483900 [compost metagenome]
MLAEDHVEHHAHDHHQGRRHDGVEHLDRGGPLGDHETGQDDGEEARRQYQPAVGVGLVLRHETGQAIDGAAEHQSQHCQPAHGEEHHCQHIDQPATVAAEHAAQESELLGAVLAAGYTGGEGGQQHPENVTDDDGGDALHRPDEKRRGTTNEEGPGGDGQGGVGVGEFPEAPHAFRGEERRIAPLGFQAVIDGFVTGHGSVPPEVEADDQNQRHQDGCYVVDGVQRPRPLSA